jgi:histidine kinase/DNA gyrase B/HSP90-like ATPase/PAS domain-containing protein
LARVTAHAPAATYVGGKGSILAQQKPALDAIFLGSGCNFEQFLAEVPGVLYECDGQLSVTFISSNTRLLIGVDPQELIGRQDLWGGRLFPDDRKRLTSVLKDLPPGQTVSVTHRIVDQRGLPVWVSHSFRKAATKSGELLRGCLIPLPKENCTHDIASSIIPQFVHKIGNHFQLINLLIGNLRRSGMAAGDVDALQQALDDTVEFTRIFLNYAQAPTCQSEFDLSEILKAVMQAMVPVFAEKKISLKNLVDVYFSGVLVQGDPFLLEIGFQAILQNALDATNTGGEVTVRATCERHRPDHGLSAQIVIDDSGCGMEPEVLTRAVEPFFTSRRDRSGLGLSMASRILEQHGGILRITSVAGQGAQVNIVLPVVSTSQAPDR